MCEVMKSKQWKAVKNELTDQGVGRGHTAALQKHPCKLPSEKIADFDLLQCFSSNMSAWRKAEIGNCTNLHQDCSAEPTVHVDSRICGRPVMKPICVTLGKATLPADHVYACDKEPCLLSRGSMRSA